ncbi:MAG: hypothetical protein H0U29_02885, partial [Acidimicrobiia bacterium]|nr:hypothetical protein [Acidimicrobiia bacterium]
MRPRKRLTLALAGVVGLLTALTISSGPVAAQEAPLTPASYINPDTGKPTENPDVDPNSGCGDVEGEAPDQDDTQPVVTDPMTDNVHTDACLFDDAGARIDVQAAFQVSGVGTISGCPDPDGMDIEGMEADDKSATLSNGDTLCVLSGYEDANEEYHVRTVSDEAGTQTITFCADPEGNGCDDAELTSTTTVTWTDDAGNGEVPQGGVDTGLAPIGESDGSATGAYLPFAAAALLAGAALLSWT